MKDKGASAEVALWSSSLKSQYKSEQPAERVHVVPDHAGQAKKGSRSCPRADWADQCTWCCFSTHCCLRIGMQTSP